MSEEKVHFPFSSTEGLESTQRQREHLFHLQSTRKPALLRLADSPLIDVSKDNEALMGTLETVTGSYLPNAPSFLSFGNRKFASLPHDRPSHKAASHLSIPHT